METYLDQYLVSLELRGFAHVTKKTYMGHMRRFVMFTKKRPEECDYEDVRRFLHHAIKRRKISASYVNSAYSAIRYYYETTLCRDWNMRHVPRLKIRPPLPNVLTIDEVRRVLAATENLKQRAMLSTCYSSGLRVNELVHLKVKDIDSESMRLRVQYGKGGKSRNTILSKDNLLLLRQYYRQYRPQDWLFPGAIAGDHISTRTAQVSYNKAARIAGIEKAGSIHTLRHSFATHLLNQGELLTTIRDLLGHATLTATSRYLHMTKAVTLGLKSPMDRWEEDDD